MATSEAKTNLAVSSVNFFKEAWAELKKVHRPTRQETVQMTKSVILLIVIFAVFLGLVDFISGYVMRWLLNL